jgi:hypothetical protein
MSGQWRLKLLAEPNNLILGQLLEILCCSTQISATTTKIYTHVLEVLLGDSSKPPFSSSIMFQSICTEDGEVAHKLLIIILLVNNPSTCPHVLTV